MAQGCGPEELLQGMLGEAGLKAVSWENDWPREREEAFSDLAFSSTWPVMVSPPGVPVASLQVWISLVRAALMTRNPSGKCWKAPASQSLDHSFYWCVFCGTESIPQSKRNLHIQYLLAISCHISSIAHFGGQQGEGKALPVRFQFIGVADSGESTLNSPPQGHNL